LFDIKEQARARLPGEKFGLGGNLRQRLCENYFQKFNVVIRDSFIAVLVWWVGNSSQYQFDHWVVVGGIFSSRLIIRAFTQPRPGTDAQQWRIICYQVKNLIMLMLCGTYKSN